MRLRGWVKSAKKQNLSPTSHRNGNGRNKMRYKKSNKIATHQLNTNFILWIWFSKLNTTISGRASTHTHTTLPPHHCHPAPICWLCCHRCCCYCLDNTKPPYHQTRPRHMKDANVECNTKIYMWHIGTTTYVRPLRCYMWKCLFHLYLSFLSFPFFPLIFVCVHVFHQPGVHL